MSGEAEVQEKSRIVATGQGHLHLSSPVASQDEIPKHIGVEGNLYRFVAILPAILEVLHGVAKALKVQSVQVDVPGEVSEVASADKADDDPLREEHLSRGLDPRGLY